MENYREQNKSKYQDMLVDGVWKVVKIYTKTADRRPIYTVENIYNNKRIDICYSTFKNILEGKTSVSRVIFKRIKGVRYERTRNSGDWILYKHC